MAREGLQKLFHEAKWREVGDRLRRYRRRRKVTQARLAAHLNISRPSLTNIEKGIRKIDAVEMVKICQMLDTTPMEILGANVLDF